MRKNLERILKDRIKDVNELKGKILRTGVLGLSLTTQSCYPAIQEPKQVFIAREEQSVNQTAFDAILRSTYKLKVESLLEEEMFDKGDGSLLGKLVSKVTGYGSCFAFARDNQNNRTYFLTTDHCFPQEPEDKVGEYLHGFVSYKKKVSNIKAKVVADTNGEEKDLFELNIVKRNKDKDITLMSVETPKSKIYSWYPVLADKKFLTVGRDVYCAGFPQTSVDWGKQVTRGIVSNVLPEPALFGEGIVLTESVLDFGMSGGPAFINHNGNLYVVGLNARIAKDLTHKFGITTGLLEIIEEEKINHLITQHKTCSELEYRRLK